MLYFVDADPDPESFWPWIREGKIWIRDKYPGFATLKHNKQFGIKNSIFYTVSSMKDVEATGEELCGSALVLLRIQIFTWKNTFSRYKFKKTFLWRHKNRFEIQELTKPSLILVNFHAAGSGSRKAKSPNQCGSMLIRIRIRIHNIKM